jgi:hypothetical protein
MGAKGFSNGGARPGAGRPSLIDEGLRARVIEKSWGIINDFLNDENEPKRDRVKVAEHLAGKSVPQNINLGGQADNHLSVVKLVTMNDDGNANKTSVKGN